MSNTIPSTHFSTSDLPAADQFDAWRDKISVVFDVDRTGGSRSASFEARVDAYMIGDLFIGDSTQGEQAYSVTPTRARAAGMGLFQIALYRSGGYRGDASGNAIEGKPGDVEVLDLTGRCSRSIRRRTRFAHSCHAKYCRTGLATWMVCTVLTCARAWVACSQITLACLPNGSRRCPRAMVKQRQTQQSR